MPLYDYDCANCGRRFEVIHGVHADPPASCPLCGGGPVKKAIQAPAVHFKGSGWAKKERRAGKSGSGSSTGSKSEDASDSGAATSSKADAKGDKGSTSSGGSDASSGSGSSSSSGD